MNSEFQPSSDFVARVMDRVAAVEAARTPPTTVLLFSRPARYLLACGTPLLLLLRAAPVF